MKFLRCDSVFSAVLKYALRRFQNNSFGSGNFVTWKKIENLQMKEYLHTMDFRKFFLVKQILSPENFEKNSKKGALMHWIRFSATKYFTLWKLYSGFVLYDFCFASFR